MKLKNMKSVFYIKLILIHLIVFAYSAIGQKTIQIGESKLFIKNNIKLSTDVAHITACSDAKLSKNCKSYFAIGSNEYQETTLTSSEANSISKSKNLSGLKNVNTEKVNKQVSLSYIDKHNSRIYFFGHGKNLNIVEYNIPTTPIAKRPSSAQNIACRSACQDAKDKCFKDCVMAGGSGYENCYDGCAISFLGCTGICDKYVKKVQIVLENILVKPISFQNK